MGGELEKSNVVPFAAAELATGQRPSRPEQGSRKAPSPRNCKPYVRKRLAIALPAIADVLIDKAQQGGLPELKMLVQMSGLHEKSAPRTEVKRRGKSLEEMLMEDWRKEPLDEPTEPTEPIR